ncbi:ATPase [Photobacterium aquae]|uniref:Cell division protein ZapE n=1 Tax=Photobacterium aquae TaxID=1195763 RepID=A0A0J1H371_9GAMM|nr:cell division protein ZapE [Photobacterium aquae]KLV06199.1 ATPase [Photobacterium aquae]
MTPQQKYRQDLTREGFIADPAQAEAVRHLDELYHRLMAPRATPSPSLWQRVLRQAPPSPPPVRGLYFWGGVGRGKTYLVDTFFECLPLKRKMRVHFHRFMQRVHDELRLLGAQSDPLEMVADRFCEEADLICFDEFFVSDITDAMLLGTLFEALFRRGITLVATSNIPPDDLYRNGLQRSRFLPAIALIKAHCEVVNLDGGVDYRLRTLELAEIYHYPLDGAAKDNMTRYFNQLAGTVGASAKSLVINQRPLVASQEHDGVVHFDFSTLCLGPRSQSDYMEIARLYHTVLLSGVTVMGEEHNDAARRFIALVDEFYERNVTLIISAEVAWNDLYQGYKLAFEFQRCCSRLSEMQSHEYLARAHLV